MENREYINMIEYLKQHITLLNSMVFTKRFDQCNRYSRPTAIKNYADIVRRKNPNKVVEEGFDYVRIYSENYKMVKEQLVRYCIDNYDKIIKSVIKDDEIFELYCDYFEYKGFFSYLDHETSYKSHIVNGYYVVKFPLEGGGTGNYLIKLNGGSGYNFKSITNSEERILINKFFKNEANEETKKYFKFKYREINKEEHFLSSRYTTVSRRKPKHFNLKEKYFNEYDTFKYNYRGYELYKKLHYILNYKPKRVELLENPREYQRKYRIIEVS